MFSDEETSFSVERREPNLVDSSSEMLAIRRKFPKKNSQPTKEAFTRIGVDPLIIQNNQLASSNYNSELDRYFGSYAQYLERTNSWIEGLARTHEVEFMISNEGSAVATDIDVTLEFPSNISLMELEDLESKPSAPAEPIESDAFGLRGLALSSITPLIHRPEMRFPGLKGDGSPHIMGNTVQFSANSVKHGHIFRFDRFLFRFPELSVKSFEISVFITAIELPQRVEHKLAVVVDDEAAEA